MHATFDGVAKSMVDLRRIVEVLTAANQEVPQNDLAELVNRLNVTRDAVRDTINVLEESKRAFKSKRLGELRRQLQSVLNFLEQE
jgi:Ca2+-binding EF-hand superfamily protein